MMLSLTERPKKIWQSLKPKQTTGCLLLLEMEQVRTEQLLSSPVSGEVSHPVDRGMLGAHCSIGSIFILSTLCKKLICVCIGHMTVVNSNCFLFLTIRSRNLMMLRLSGILEEVCKCIS